MARRGARVDESACLESTCPGNGTVGSNPTLSAIPSFARTAPFDQMGAERSFATRVETWRARSFRSISQQAMTRQPYQRAIKFYCHEKVSLSRRTIERRAEYSERLVNYVALRDTALRCSSPLPIRYSGAPLPDYLRSDVYRAKGTGLGPVRQNPVNPARSGRKQR